MRSSNVHALTLTAFDSPLTGETRLKRSLCGNFKCACQLHEAMNSKRLSVVSTRRDHSFADDGQSMHCAYMKSMLYTVDTSHRLCRDVVIVWS